MGTGPILVSYLSTMGEARAAAWEIAAGSGRSARVGGTSGCHVL